MLTLYHFGPVANSLAPLLCLIEKGLAFEDRFLVSRRWDHHQPAFRAINPRGTVPVLVHDDRAIVESTIINEYLEDLFPEVRLRPADPWTRAQMRIWTKFVDEYFTPALTVLGAHRATPFAASIGKPEMEAILARMPDREIRRKWATVAGGGYPPEQVEDARARLASAIERIETQFGHGEDWIVGDAYSLADIKLLSIVRGVERIAPALCCPSVAPRLHAWLRRTEARPAVVAMLGRDYPLQSGLGGTVPASAAADGDAPA